MLCTLCDKVPQISRSFLGVSLVLVSPIGFLALFYSKMLTLWGPVFFVVFFGLGGVFVCFWEMV